MRCLPLVFILLIGLTAGCDSPIKNADASVEVESGAEVPASPTDIAPAAAPEETMTKTTDDGPGFWVGDFRPGDGHAGKEIEADMWFWNRSNKINISIDRIVGDSVYGHSVVAGNDRPFAGTRSHNVSDGTYAYEVREPGDDRYDGAFTFTIEGGQLTGTWKAYNKIDISERKYVLTRQEFAYDPAILLEQSQQYIDWTKSKKEMVDVGDDEEWLMEQFSASTFKIYELNASTDRLTKAQVENLKKGDLTIIRNTIYARHGYSFKNRPLRVFFDAQEWYIPVHADIRADFTDIEKENIKLLLTYEKNAKEYYDSFGRG